MDRVQEHQSHGFSSQLLAKFFALKYHPCQWPASPYQRLTLSCLDSPERGGCFFAGRDLELLQTVTRLKCDLYFLQVIDPHTHQYMDRMKDEPVFLALASKASDYLGSRGEFKSHAKIALRRVEHFYYKTDTVYTAMRRMTIAQQEAQAQSAPAQQVFFPIFHVLWPPLIAASLSSSP